ncbi:calcium-activated chloride channel regulator 1-like [Thamnophis elegans]|uniref:calcium-activated chloride channel regulator 1-like n=1 Tax=Thamnophis elegans TaxID=35005 RepID=UPI0013771C45|nr:calcium-activated chloride channel regulator 1-like [Thamnophis elegans]XP_032073795.1 calcium-activated chloride channel regulator 1-like [Thamnophis elegans]XP_032073796.1 calcium-activated chloride channel regulator 1-like [Thamnophis elegans]XP_032073797.1 calcium-activated chloride channel regulator 1-like [Thamnophis elegans]
MALSQDILVIMMLLHGVMGTMINLNNNGFENIVIAINPTIPEDAKIITNIQNMVKEASNYLINATERRFYFKSVKIIIPLTWQKKTEYERVIRESYEKADIIVADPHLKSGDDPYTLQFGGCGIPGRYIHFTPTFLTNDNLHDVYGSRGRVFVHEWAHLRWGVFDEYNYDAPFYVTKEKKVEATRCSAGVTGIYIFPTGPGNHRDCIFLEDTQMYEPGCQFVADISQSTPVSIMYMQSLPSVAMFCDKSNHNIEAPNLQNKFCNYKSTWEVIMNSTDFASSSIINTPPPDPIFTLMQTRDRVVCLVLDVSGSMADYDRIGRLRQAAEVFLLQIIELGSWAGIVTFHSSATVQTQLQQIVSDNIRKNLVNYLPTRASGGTNICAGARKGFEVIRLREGTTEGCEIVLLTDGEDSTIGSCFDEVKSSGSIIHTIALGPSAAKELDKLAEMTGGLKYAAFDSLDANGLIDVFSGISSDNGDIYQQSIQIESKSQKIDAGNFLNGIVSIDHTIGNDTFFVLTWSEANSKPGILLTDPKMKTYNHNNFTVDTTNHKTARLKIDGTAETGDWTYTLYNTHSVPQVLSITVTSRAASLTEPPVIVKSYLSSDTNTFPNPIIIYAEVSQEFFPVLGAIVTATIESNSASEKLELWDKGSGADIIKNDGIYSRYFTSFKENGRYSIKVHVQGRDGTSRQTRQRNHALYVPGYIENGEIKMNAPRPEASDNDTQANLGKFSRIASGGSFVMSGVTPGNPSDVFPPSRITDLEAELNDEDEFLLSWTAPGNDYDIGTAEKYEIKMSENPDELRDTFQNAASVNTSDLKPDATGIKQSFQYKMENFTKENGTAIYFAIRASDGSNNVGEVSNIARAVVLLPPLLTTPLTPTDPSSTHPTPTNPPSSTHPTPTNPPSSTHPTPTNPPSSAHPKPTNPPSSAPPTPTNPYTSKGNSSLEVPNNESPGVINMVTLIVIIVCIALIIICACICITICVLHKQKKVNPQTVM